MKHFIRHFPALWRASRLARRWYHARRHAYPDWSQPLAADGALWDSARAAAQGGPRVLMATAIGSYAHAVTLESALAAALTFRGADVHALLCDGTMTACAECEASLYPNLRAFAEHGPSRDLCRDCRWPAERVYTQLGLKVHRMGDWLAPADREDARRVGSSLPLDQIGDFTLDGLAIGEHAHAGALRFFATGSLDQEPHAEAILRRYLESALLTAFATRRLMREVRFSSAVFTHGIYVPWGIVGEVARQEGVRVSNWNVAYRKRRFIFSHGDTYHHTLLSEPARGNVRLDRLPSPDEAGSAEDCEADRPRPVEAGDRPAHQRCVGRAAPLPGQRVPQHARVARADVRVLRHAAGPAAADSGASGGDQRLSAVTTADPRRAPRAPAAPCAEHHRRAAGERLEHVRADVAL